MVVTTNIVNIHPRVVTNNNIFLWQPLFHVILFCTSWTYGYLTAPHSVIRLIYWVCFTHLGLNWVVGICLASDWSRATACLTWWITCRILIGCWVKWVWWWTVIALTVASPSILIGWCWSGVVRLWCCSDSVAVFGAVTTHCQTVLCPICGMCHIYVL